MDITVHNIIKEEDIRFEGIEYMPSKLSYYSFAVLVSQIIRRHHNIVVEINSYRSRVKEIEGSILDSADISEFDVMNINDIKKGLVEAFNKFRISEKQVKMYVLLYNVINKCYSKCVGWCKGLSKDDIMRMVFNGTGIEILETTIDRYRLSMDNTQADIKANTAAVNYDKMFQFADGKKLKLKTGEQDQSYCVPPSIYDNGMEEDINTFISIYINTGVLKNIFHDDKDEIIARIEAQKKARQEALRKQKEEEERELENDEIMQILNNSLSKSPDTDSKPQTETVEEVSDPADSNRPENVSGTLTASDTSVSYNDNIVIDDKILWESKERNRYNIINKNISILPDIPSDTETAIKQDNNKTIDTGHYNGLKHNITTDCYSYNSNDNEYNRYSSMSYNMNDNRNSKDDISDNIKCNIDVDIGPVIDSS